MPLNNNLIVSLSEEEAYMLYTRCYEESRKSNEKTKFLVENGQKIDPISIFFSKPFEFDVEQTIDSYANKSINYKNLAERLKTILLNTNKIWIFQLIEKYEKYWEEYEEIDKNLEDMKKTLEEMKKKVAL